MTPQEKQLKARFFGMHIGCKVKYLHTEDVLGNDGVWHHEYAGWRVRFSNEDGAAHLDNCKLILRPISSITDTDAKEITDLLNLPFLESGKISGGGVRIEITSTVYGNKKDTSIWILLDGTIMLFENDGDYGGAKFERINNTLVVDFLRSKFYCLPYMGMNPVAENWAISEETNC